MVKQYRIAAIPADGIGPEVIGAGLEVLDALAPATAVSRWCRPLRLGLGLVPQARRLDAARRLARLRTADAIYFGAVGAPTFPTT